MADHETSAFDADFDAFRAALLPQVTPAGPAAVRTTVRRRRRIAVTTAAAVAVALIVGPVAGYAALNRGPAPPPPASVTSPTPTDSPSPSVSPSASPTQSASATPAAPDGRISRATLLKAKLNLPDWQADAPAWCTTNGVRLRDMANASAQKAPTLMTTVYADADGDGAQETVAILGCLLGEAAAQQVVVFDRDQQGHIVILGQVTSTEEGAAASGGIEWITDLRTATPGSVQVQVADLQPCCDTPEAWAQKQWRTYGWTGLHFTQTGGPTTFGPNPLFTDLGITASDVVFSTRPDDTSWRHATMTVTIRNAGPTTAKQPYLWISFGTAVVRHEGTGWSSCTEVSDTATVASTVVWCKLQPLRAGEQRTLVLGLSDSAAQPGKGTGVADLNRIGTDMVPDLDSKNNRAEFSFR